MSSYLYGTDVIGTDERDAVALSADQGHRLIALAVTSLDAANRKDFDFEATDRRGDLMRQLANMDQSITMSDLDEIPKGAAAILRKTIRRATEECHIMTQPRRSNLVKSSALPFGGVNFNEILGEDPYRTEIVGANDLDRMVLGALRDVDGAVIGMFDIQARQRDMNKLQQVPVSVAHSLLKWGQQVIENAILVANDKGLPGPTARKNVDDHLAWHQTALLKETNPSAMYTPGQDLKQWVMRAFIEANAVEEGSQALDSAWSQMWSEIADNLAALPAAVAKKVGDVAEEVATTAAFYTKVTFWVAIGAVGLVAYGAYRLLRSQFASNTASHALGAYLGRRR